MLDVTDAVRPRAANRLAVRVLNPTNEPIDGIKLAETAHTAKSPEGWAPGRGANWGGITDSVEWIAAPAVRVEDLFVRRSGDRAASASRPLAKRRPPGRGGAVRLARRAGRQR